MLRLRLLQRAQLTREPVQRNGMRCEHEAIEVRTYAVQAVL
jgi:hypothetical protein